MVDYYNGIDGIELNDTNNQNLKITLVKNSETSFNTEIIVKPRVPFVEFCEKVAYKLNYENIKTLRFFKNSGIELFEEDLGFLRNGDVLIVSRGEDFNEQSFFDEYDIISELGEGGFGKVMLGVHKKTQEKVALKFVKNTHISNANDIDRIFSEARALKALNHKNIVKILNFFTLKKMKFCFVMEYLGGGELKEYVTKKGFLDEREAQYFFKQIVEAIYYCHRMGIIHRDLKLENILLDSLENRNIKVVDFGIAGICASSSEKTEAGSLKYIAPEVLKSKATSPSLDIWALGCILFRFLHGYAPFDGSDRRDIANLIINGTYTISSKVKKNFSRFCLDLLSRMLIVNIEKRITMVEINNHPWITGDIEALLEEERVLREQEKQKMEEENKSEEEEGNSDSKKNILVSPTRKRRTVPNSNDDKKKQVSKEEASINKSLSPVKGRNIKKLSYPPQKIDLMQEKK